jgi:membrane fusion protein (multidrug efflux system)
MRIFKSKWFIALSLVVIVAIVVVLILNRQKPVSVILPVVATQSVGVEDVEIYGEYVGRIRAQQFVEVHARVEGYLQKMLFDEGTYIEKGQTLFQIDPTLYMARAKRAEAQLNKAKAQALKAERDLSRIRPLFELNAASQLDLDNAIANYEGAIADVAVCEADMVQAQMTLDYTTVKSPISGYISERNADIGALVGPGSQSLLATIVKSDTVQIDFSMTSLEYLNSKSRNVNLGQADTTRTWNPYVTVTMADGSVYPYRGLVNFADHRSTPRLEHSLCVPRCLTPSRYSSLVSSHACAYLWMCVRMPSLCLQRLSLWRVAVRLYM